MKKTALFILFTFFLVNASFSQLETFPDDSDLGFNANQKGNHIFDVYYGVPFKGLLIRLMETNPGINSYKTRILGPAGLRYQYMLLEDFGLGIDISYEQKSTTTNIDYYDPLSGYSENYNATLTITKIKAMARFSWEFLNTEKVTMNWANSIGYRNVTREFDDQYSSLGLTFKGNIPVAMRSAVGVRVFFIDNLALHGEFGILGGGWFLGGISAKF